MLVMVLLNRCWLWRVVAVESCRRWHCQFDVGRGVMLLPSHASNGVAEVMLAVARCRCRVMLVMVLSSIAGDDAVESTLAVAVDQESLEVTIQPKSNRRMPLL
jgi:hypothetical protein